MGGLPRMVIWYTFLAVVAYLLLAHYRGANALLGTGLTGYAGIVRELQGRGQVGRAVRRGTAR